jgi:hypothetical protein
MQSAGGASEATHAMGEPYVPRDAAPWCVKTARCTIVVRIVNNVVHTAEAVMIDTGQGQAWRKEKVPSE